MIPMETAPVNPFPGLRPFDFEQHHLFFGRQEQVDQLLEVLEAKRFLVVLGPSGSGPIILGALLIITQTVFY